MSNVLFVTGAVPWPLENGAALRVVNLARHLSPSFKPYMAILGDNGPRVEELKKQGFFQGVETLSPITSLVSPLKVFRLSNRDMHARFNSAFSRKVRDKLTRLIENWKIDLVVAHGLDTGEFVAPFQGVRKIIDDCDCKTLTMERAWDHEAASWNLKRRLNHKLQMTRVQNLEKHLAGDFDLVTTISAADQNTLLRLNGSAAPIHVVPNGVKNELLDFVPNAGIRKRAVAFWGALDFSVNDAAIQYFLKYIYSPYLADKDVEFHIIGKNPSKAVQEMTRSNPSIILPGFVEDLEGYLASIPIMVNPMVSGSGLKNKVLESFGLEMAVVTTSMGIEAIEARDREHCLVADDPGVFAKKVTTLLDDPGLQAKLAANGKQLVKERYSWQRVGRDFSQLIEEVLKT